MNHWLQKKKTLILLCFVFMAPGILAFVFYNYPHLLRGMPTNRGKLIQPPIKITLPEVALTTDKWHVLVWCHEGCDSQCLTILDEMARVRLALGRRLYQVDLWLLENQNQPRCASSTLKTLSQVAVHHAVVSPNIMLFQAQTKIYLMDPNHFVVLEYQPRGKPSDVFQDLKHLLNTQE